MIEDHLLRSLAWGPLRKVATFTTYFVNGYKFNIKSQSHGMSTTNYGVYVQGSGSSQMGDDYYGILVDIVELEYIGWPIKRLVLFKCEWFDPTPN